MEEWRFRWPGEPSLVRDALQKFILDGDEYPLTSKCVQEFEANDEPDVAAIILEGKT
jgi:hypothetical protein